MRFLSDIILLADIYKVSLVRHQTAPPFRHRVFNSFLRVTPVTIDLAERDRPLKRDFRGAARTE